MKRIRPNNSIRKDSCWFLVTRSGTFDPMVHHRDAAATKVQVFFLLNPAELDSAFNRGVTGTICLTLLIVLYKMLCSFLSYDLMKIFLRRFSLH